MSKTKKKNIHKTKQKKTMMIFKKLEYACCILLHVTHCLYFSKILSSQFFMFAFILYIGLNFIIFVVCLDYLFGFLEIGLFVDLLIR
jgi:cellulose synthase/poly-beta-1,6-N-acetylglucosamine synthase-like glycosyltransferase